MKSYSFHIPRFHRPLFAVSGLLLMALVFRILAPQLAKAGERPWVRLSSSQGDLPVPGTCLLYTSWFVPSMLRLAEDASDWYSGRARQNRVGGRPMRNLGLVFVGSVLAP